MTLVLQYYTRCHIWLPYLIENGFAVDTITVNVIHNEKSLNCVELFDLKLRGRT